MIHKLTYEIKQTLSFFFPFLAEFIYTHLFVCLFVHLFFYNSFNVTF